MRRKIIFGVCFAAALGLSATGFFLNQRSSAQDTLPKAEPEKKKDDLFEILKGALESKKEVSQPLPAAPTLPEPPPSQPKDTVAPPPQPAPVIPPPTVPALKDEKPSTPPPMLPPVVDGPKAPVPAPVVQPKDLPSAFPMPPLDPKPAVTPPPPPIVDVKPAAATTPAATQAVVPPPTKQQHVADKIKQANEAYRQNKLDEAEIILRLVLEMDPENVSALATKMLIQTKRNQDQNDREFKVPVKPNLDVPPVQSNKPTTSVQLEVVEAVVKRNCPWTMHVEMIDGQTIVTATVHKKHEFRIVCQTLDLQTGKRELKASGKVQISSDMMSGACEHLSISLADDRLVLEGAAEVRIQKVPTNVSDTPASSFELKGQVLNLRISDIQSGKVLQTGLRQASDASPALLPSMPGKAVSLPTGDRKAGSGQQWTKYGVLRHFEIKNHPEGETVWCLEDQRTGHYFVFLVARDGGTLKQYEGQRISVLGAPTRVAGQDVLRVTHIALP